MESGQLLKIFKAQRVLQVLVVAMERMEVTARTVAMEKQLQMHRQLQQ
jgi:hypothetical protein